MVDVKPSEECLAPDINQCWVVGCTNTITLLPGDDCHCTFHQRNPPKGSETISQEELFGKGGESA